MSRISFRRRPRSTSRSRFRRLLDALLTVAILGLLLMVAGRLERFASVELAGEAVVNDGDSLTIGGDRVRLKDIDAPELAQSCRRAGGDYACGRQSREALRRLVNAGKVVCSGGERDRFGRLLAYCMAGETDINRSQVADGWAVAYGGYEDAEAEARAAGRGIWVGEFDQPRDWRAMHGDATDDGAGLFTRLWAWVTALFGAG